MTYKEALAFGYEKLKGTEQPVESARFLLKHILNKDLSDILAYPEKKLVDRQERHYREWLEARAKHMPVWYITGFERFYGLEFKVDQRVLIPRPETEIMVEKVLEATREMEPDLVVADIGTGSGAIGISIAKNLPKARVYLCDISQEALAVAEENVRLNKAKNISVLEGALLECLPEPVDILTANLPYVPSEDIDSMALDIVHYEPRIALDGGADGLDLYRDFFKQAPGKIKPGGKMFLEIGEEQGSKLTTIVQACFPTANVRFEKDWAGLDRFVIVELSKKE